MGEVAEEKQTDLEATGEPGGESQQGPEPKETEQKPDGKETEGAGEKTAIDDLLEAEADTEEETEAEVEPDEGGKIPYSRFSKVYGKSKELERKFDLLRRDPEAYYKLYPEDRPQEQRSDTRQQQSRSVNLADLDRMQVQGGTYDGLTLAEVRERDPGAAAQLENNYLRTNLPDFVRSQVRDALTATQRETQAQRLREESEQEIDTWRNDRAKEFFGKDVSKLGKDEAQKIDRLADQCLSWAKKTGRGGGKMEDIYYLMTRDRQIAKARAAGAGAILDAATKGGKVRSIRTGGGEGAAGGGFDKLLDLSPAQAAREIEKMTDKKFSELMKTGSSELRAKYPGWPWGR